jgi:hypothetical protein
VSNDTTVLAEARALYRMLGAGHTVEELRECISVPPKIERKLKLYAAMNPVEARWIEKILKFRNVVAHEFERLACEGMQDSAPASGQIQLREPHASDQGKVSAVYAKTECPRPSKIRVTRD